MKLLIVRLKVGTYVPTNPEDKHSALRPATAGTLAIIPEDFVLIKDSFDVVQTIKVKNNDN